MFQICKVRGRARSPNAPQRWLVESERVIPMENDGALGEHALPPARSRLQRQSGQALLEMTVGLIVFAVVFLAVLLVGDLGRARMTTLLESRKEAGSDAIAGLLSGSPVFYGGADPSARLQSEVMAPMDETITYSQYTTPNYPYMTKNLVAPLYNPNGTMIAAFSLTLNEQTQYVTNSEFMVNMKVGQAKITVLQRTCLPILKGFQ